MEHMKHTHKDPNASGVASKYPKLRVDMLNERETSVIKNFLFLFFLLKSL